MDRRIVLSRFGESNLESLAFSVAEDGHRDSITPLVFPQHEIKIVKASDLGSAETDDQVPPFRPPLAAGLPGPTPEMA
jgi:hypothetical protein